MKGKFVDAVVSWALAALRGDKERTAARAALDKLEHAPLALLTQRFGLAASERRLIELLWAGERSLEVAREARARSGARGITVEVARETLGESIEERLAANSPLARAALVIVEEPWVSARAGLALGPWLAARLDGTAASLDGVVEGVRAAASLDRWAEQFPGSARMVELAKEFASHEALLATVDGCGRRDALGLAVQVARRFARGLIAVDGEVLAAGREAATLLRALRREADLEAQVLLVFQAAALGEAWRAVTSPPPAQPQRAPLVIVTDGARTREVTLVEGLRHQHAAVGAGATPAPASAPVQTVKPPEEDAFEQIRKQAARDAERAMGIFRPISPAPAAAPAPVATPPAPAPARVEAAAPPPPSAPAPKADETTNSPQKPKKSKRSKKAIEMFGPDPEDVEASPSAAGAPPPAAAPPVPPVGGAGSDAPYLDLGAEPTLQQLASALRSAPNPRQRLELIVALRGVKTPVVVAALRDNTKSEHPEVRAAAEQAMQAMFGENWNRFRSVPKPVQPPVSDDKDRGPPGGW
jgi:hypothetical protein